MKKLVIGALLGGAIGALVAKLQGGGGEQDSSPMVPAVASGAAVGAFFGLVLARRARKAAKAAAVPVALAYAKKMGDVALEAAESAVEAARPLVGHAAEAARPIIDDALDRIAA
jgi:hypothetical protein